MAFYNIVGVYSSYTPLTNWRNYSMNGHGKIASRTGYYKKGQSTSIFKSIKGENQGNSIFNTIRTSKMQNESEIGQSLLQKDWAKNHKNG